MAIYSSYTEMDVWQKCRKLVKEVYMLTKMFPKEEQYGLANQMRRCVVSIPSNIAEGYGRQYKKETLHFFYIARGSIFELETQLILSRDLEYIDDTILTEVIKLLDECRRLLYGVVKYISNKSGLK